MGVWNALGSSRKRTLFGIVFLLLIHSAFGLAQAVRAKNFDDALKQASEKGRFIVLDISASW